MGDNGVPEVGGRVLDFFDNEFGRFSSWDFNFFSFRFGPKMRKPRNEPVGVRLTRGGR